VIQRKNKKKIIITVNFQFALNINSNTRNSLINVLKRLQ